ncbi:hypothetical protein UCDDA912_g08905 [Diaporthe ampelina]|uniref:RING-type domain-containing protein n=1 Tax=Diaporthe ampelina TaxID=1214573 RepID=A0A0G2F912_9PEZI|nr:hypothetical protein UCDDA912_g08905 [Diaporthe ampelina]
MSPSYVTPSLPTVQSRKRKHSDISGLNVDGPAKRTKSRHAEKEETNLWTTVKRYLEDPAAHGPQPSVSCVICTIPIAIRGIPILEPDPWKLADGSQKVGAVLPCAHIFCQECINAHMAAQDELDPTGHKSCPFCRGDLLFTGCLHTVPPQRLPIATSEDFSMAPLTMPELQPGFEHRFPEDCWECTAQASEEYINLSLRFVSEVLHGVGYLPGEGPPEWDDLVGASQQLVREHQERQRLVPSWRNGSVPAGLLRARHSGTSLSAGFMGHP